MRKLAAFTIIELCVVMLLTAIVTGIAFFTLDIFSHATRKYRKDSGQVADLLVLHRLMEEDISSCQALLVKENGCLLAHPQKPVSYQFSPEMILRTKASVTDTFAFETHPVSYRFQQTETSLPGQPADEISFVLTHQQEEFPFYFYKTYSAAALMDYDPHLPD